MQLHRIMLQYVSMLSISMNVLLLMIEIRLPMLALVSLSALASQFGVSVIQIAGVQAAFLCCSMPITLQNQLILLY